MSKFLKRILGLILLVTTVGIATCQSLVKAAENPLVLSSVDVNRLV